MSDPVLRILYQGGHLLARRIVNTLLPEDTPLYIQEGVIEILDQAFRYRSRTSWTAVRQDIVDRIQHNIQPQLGERRTTELLQGVQTQVNRIARENNIQIENPNWLFNDEDIQRYAQQSAQFFNDMEPF